MSNSNAEQKGMPGDSPSPKHSIRGTVSTLELTDFSISDPLPPDITSKTKRLWLFVFSFDHHNLVQKVANGLKFALDM